MSELRTCYPKYYFLLRRASLAVALLHEPPLIILDEPTVGVDPILRQALIIHHDAYQNNRDDFNRRKKN